VVPRSPTPAPAPAPGGAVPAWRTELEAIRAAAAERLFALANRAVSGKSKQYSLADECLRAVLDRQPDHKEARRLLGYVPHAGGWATPYAARQLNAGMVQHATFGWVDATWVPHLDKGELEASMIKTSRPPRWLPAEQADRLHAKWKDRWKIATEHFKIETNAPYAKAMAFARHLEPFHDLFTAQLADVIALGIHLPLAQRYQDPNQTGEKPEDLHQIYYFNTKEEYVAYLQPTEGPGIADSLGIYVPPKPGQRRRAPAFFFRDDGGQIEATATLYHEVSHELLFEMAGLGAFQKNAGNYWVFEGLGTYFETVVAGPGGTLEVGGLVGPRIEQARLRLVENREFIPIEQFVAMDQAAFNARVNGGDIHLQYQEAIALAVFLMQAQGRAYREGFLEYVKDAYRGRIKRDVGRSLAEQVGASYKTLDAQFLDYLKGAEAQADAR
jgi:hypothetical protein